jgi:ferrous-iron efflux pump FieF
MPDRRHDASNAPRRAPAVLSARSRSLMLSAGIASVSVAIALIVLKAWAWQKTHSVAMLSSLVDSSLDLMASLITLLAIRVSLVPPDREHRFGHGKSEGIAGLLQSVIVLASGTAVAAQAIQRWLSPTLVLEPDFGSAISVVALLLTGGLVAFQHYVVQHTRSLAVSADALHYKSDLLGNAAVLAAMVLSARYGLEIIDPICGLLIALLILFSVRGMIGQTLHVLLDHELPTEDRQRIEAIAFAHPAVLGVHDVRTRSSGHAQFVQLHLELDSGLPLAEVHAISSQVERSLHDAYPRAEILIHPDPHGLVEPRDPF